MTMVMERSERGDVTTKTVSGEFADLYYRADKAGKAAAAAARPTPMVVGTPSTPLGNDVDPNKTRYFVPDGVCGFAWIAFAGNTAFGRWAKREKIVSKHYPKGLSIWVGDYGQSMELKEAYARAFAKVLKEAGVEAYAGSRMD